jgi:hypothetical protein
MGQLVLSLFPGIGLLDRAFEAEGFVVVCDTYRQTLRWSDGLHAMALGREIRRHRPGR